MSRVGSALSSKAPAVLGIVGTVVSGYFLIPPSSARAADPVSAVCFAGKLRDVDRVQPDDRGKGFPVVAAASRTGELAQHGFVPGPCPEELSEPQDHLRYRDEICAMSRDGNEGVQVQVAEAIGIDPRRLCEMAEEDFGPAARD